MIHDVEVEMRRNNGGSTKQRKHIMDAHVVFLLPQEGTDVSVRDEGVDPFVRISIRSQAGDANDAGRELQFFDHRFMTVDAANAIENWQTHAFDNTFWKAREALEKALNQSARVEVMTQTFHDTGRTIHYVNLFPVESPPKALLHVTVCARQTDRDHAILCPPGIQRYHWLFTSTSTDERDDDWSETIYVSLTDSRHKLFLEETKMKRAKTQRVIREIADTVSVLDWNQYSRLLR